MKLRWRLLGATLTREVWPAWLAAAGVVLALGIGLGVSSVLSTDASAAIRYAGTLLQVSGLGTVAWGLSETRKLFPDRSSTGDRILAWFKRVGSAFRRPEPTEVQASTAGMAMVGGKLRVRVTAPSDASLERRVQILETNLKQLEDELDAEVQGMTKKIDSVAADLRGERNERQQEDRRTTRLIEETAVGGLDLEIVGLIWLVLGVLGTGFPDEIAKLIGFVR